MRRPSVRTVALLLTSVLALAAALGSLALAMTESAQDAVVSTPAANSDAGEGWSWVALVSFYVALVVLAPTIGAWWVYWTRRPPRDPPQ